MGSVRTFPGPQSADAVAGGPGSLPGANRHQVLIPCANPASTVELGMQIADEAFEVDAVDFVLTTLPSTTGAFDVNIRNQLSNANTGGDLWATSPTIARRVDPTVFKKTVNNGTTYTSYLTEVTGAGVATLDSLDTVANGDWVLIGFGEQFAGVFIDVTNTNSNPSVLTMQYYKNDGTWANLTTTDGTDNAGASFGQDGEVTWTMPSDWIKTTIDGVEAYYVRTSFDAALDSSVTVDTADIVRATNIWYTLAAPDQNTTVRRLNELRVRAAEADANAAGLQIRVRGTLS